MSQLKNIIEDCIYNGKLRKYKVSPTDIDMLVFGYQYLIKYGEFLTFSNNVARICEKCGFTVVNPHDTEINYYITID